MLEKTHTQTRINVEGVVFNWQTVALLFQMYSTIIIPCRKEVVEIKDGGLEIIDEGPLRVSAKVG